MVNEMESRKIQKVGHSTLTISLPSEWVKGAELRQGDTVFCTFEKDGSLKIMPSSVARRRTAKEVKGFIVDSDLCDEGGMLERIVVGNYVLGRDPIIITSSKRISSANMAEIRNATQRLIGLGMTEETPNRVVLQCSIDPSKFPIYTLMKRLYTITCTMHEEAVEALVKLDVTLAKEVINREDEADRIYWLIVRLLLSAQQDGKVAAKIGIEEPLEIIGNRLVANHLEKIADYAENIAANVIALEKSGDKVKKSVLEAMASISRSASETCNRAMECVFTRDVKLANAAIKAKEYVEVEEEKLMNALPEQVSDAYVATHLRAIGWGLRRIAEYGAGIAEIAINRALEKPSRLCGAK
jgi:phosphate uptake regulator